VINVTSLVFILFSSYLTYRTLIAITKWSIFRAQDGEANSLPANDDSSATWIDELRVIKKKTTDAAVLQGAAASRR